MAEKLTLLRDRALGSIKNILRFAETINESTTLEAVTSRREILEDRYQIFNELEIQLLDFPKYVSILDEVEEIYLKARELLMRACTKLGQAEPSRTPDLNATLEQFMYQQKTLYEEMNTSQHVRLPKINIAKFSGDYNYWASFYDLFKTSVHDNPKISKVQKLQILNSVLEGEASALIRHISITENNYVEAWDKLCNRYNKLTPIIASLVHTIMDQRPCVHSNGKELRKVCDTADEIIRGLRALGPRAESRDPWLIYILLGKIDNETKQLWANDSVGTDFPTVTELIAFLNKRCDALEICNATTKRSTSKPSAKTFLVANSSYNNYECIVCKQQHPLFRCPDFKNLNVESRMKLVVDKDLCRNCLKKGHTSVKCFNRASCLICNKRHHTLLHQGETDVPKSSCHSTSTHHAILDQHSHDKSSHSSNKPQHTIELKQIDNSQTTNVCHAHLSSTTTVLPTAVILIMSRTGKLQPYRALLDSGSQTSFITESCAQSLNLKRHPSSISIYGLASTSAGHTKGKINMTISSRFDPTYQLTITAHIINKIAHLLPTKPIKYPSELIKNLNLADPHFFQPNKIDVLLGADVFFEILNPEKRIMKDVPPLQSSKFGWLVAGNLENQSQPILIMHATTESWQQQQTDELNQGLRKFWEVEEPVPVSNPEISSANECETFYENSTTRNTKGQFVVRLPFKNPRPELGRSFEAAQQRLFAMERKFQRSPEFRDAYKSFIDEYIALGHMTPISFFEIPAEDNQRYYLPHHAVLKPTSSTTKLRVVFDASCKTSNGVALNDVLQIGPNLQKDLSTIIMKFRKHSIAVVADIEKMYRQILVNPEDANFQLFLWRENQRENIRVFKLNTVTYGTACAPYLAVKTLKISAENDCQLYPKAAQVISNDFYIDDLLTGSDSIQEAIKLKEEINLILQKNGFNLRKWKSNSKEFLNSFSPHDVQNIPKLIEDDSSIKTLGIIWNAELDEFSFKVHREDDATVWTKRKILSTASKAYDPLGWLAPTVILFKILFQKLWLLKTEWDASLPDHIIKSWITIYQSLPELETIRIPRHLISLQHPIQLQLHAFCDASEAAYGSVIYLRATNSIGETTVNIVYAKGKVAPIKQISLPRLELCGAVLLCKLVKFCTKALQYDNVPIFAWTDSMIVLHWLSDVPRRWKTFVGNRTAEIIESIPRDNWYHVESKCNPADLISRGVKPKALPTADLWWHGPPWLKEPQNNWPKCRSTNTQIEHEATEERPNYFHVFAKTTQDDDTIETLLNKFSSWFKILKIMVFILRFGKLHHRKQHTHKNDFVTPAEINDAEIIIVRNVQKLAFKTELQILSKGSPLPANHLLSSLDPFTDCNGILRVGGRLNKSALPYSTKHPVILPKNHVICELLVRDTHIRHMHAGNSLTLSILRNKYWIIGARYIVKRCMKTCTVCIRYRYHRNDQKMGDLPTVRCNQSRPFLKTGIDYAGPLYIKTGKRKNAPIEKAYVAVFVCLVVKAAHLEVVSSLDTESFLAALKRFIARRGLPEQIWCDNGSNFIGANKELKIIKQQIINQCNNSLILDFLLQKGIHFHFNPPHAPHFGGLWESTVKSFKYHLKRVSNVNLVFEEMTTLITQIEALLNSRPLCRLNDDPADLQILTPAHFLVGESLTALPEPLLDDIQQNKLSRWQNIQQRIQGFWKRWHHDYLTSLQQRVKWKTEVDEIQVDDVVLIKEDNLYPSQWILGKVIAAHPGDDGITRVVTLKTSKSEVKRPVNKLIKLVTSGNLK